MTVDWVLKNFCLVVFFLLFSKKKIFLCSKVGTLARDDVHQSPGKRSFSKIAPFRMLPAPAARPDVELLQLEQERKPARMSVKTSFLLFRTMAIDRLSHVSQERELTISQFLENVAVRPKL